jgi:isoamylase
MQEIERPAAAGKPYPLGATLTPDGVNFSLFSAHAARVELCLFSSPETATPERVIRILRCTNQIWHAFVPGLKAGQCYGYRVHGPFEPEKGLRFNPTKLLLDPYSKAISDDVKWEPEMFSYHMGDPAEDLSKNEGDNAGSMPKSVVIDPSFDWAGDQPPATPMPETVIYETHVKGFSKLWDALPENLRGTYPGLGSEQAIKYFKDLGVTAIELQPVHHRIDSKHLLDKGLSDYWGYNSIGFFAPDCRFASSDCLGKQVTEFKTMIKNLHAAGLEVILDVVYNHTCEGNRMGPTLCFKGIDNSSYYRLVHDNPRYYMDYTGTGNTLAVYKPNVLQLVMDSLRYWITEMHVDGFRFDLASSLARELHEVSYLSSFFDVIHQDPVISQVKLIAEPWDLGEGGYQVGKFPVLWSEWNGRYRDSVRRYWKGDNGIISELAHRLSGSADLYQSTGKTPYASVNFITAHDGFTLADLVAYHETHNEANGEDNRDGEKNNQNWNCGAEGPTDDAEINKLRRRQQRNFLTTLFLSQGTPMICGGDEYGRTQRGNNNAYCQDNEISWMDWRRDENAARLTRFVSGLVAFRKKHPVFRRLDFFRGRPIRGTSVRDVKWLNLSGRQMTDEEWNSSLNHCVGVFLSGYLRDVNDDIIQDDFFLLCFNASDSPVTFLLPHGMETDWELVIDTADEEGFVKELPPPREKITLESRSVKVLRLKPPEKSERATITDRLLVNGEGVVKG